MTSDGQFEIKSKETPLFPQANEVILALVQPTGTDLSAIKDRLYESCRKVGAELHEINLTQLLSDLNLEVKTSSLMSSKIQDFTSAEIENSKGYRELSEKMHLGTILREVTRSDIFAMYALARVFEVRREKYSGGGNEQKKRVFLLNSLKHPDELKLLRDAYGLALFLLGVNAPKDRRTRHLKERKGMKDDEAVKLIQRDEDEGKKFGQKMNKVYEQSDYFFQQSLSADETDRFIELVFGNTKLSPSREEYYMHLAASSAAMSSDLSRQVGAVLVSHENELIGMGHNEVPKAKGGQYAVGDVPDERDEKIGHDPNHKRREELLQESDIANESAQKGQDRIKNLTEFHRAVHAEMEALLSCARKGVSTRRSKMFSTTYPCHNCARHIVGAGISEVYFIEAYSKSLAVELHGDSLIEEENGGKQESCVVLKRFYGVGPRRFLDLFSQHLSSGTKIDRKVSESHPEPWKARVFDAVSARPRFPVSIDYAIMIEKSAIHWLVKTNKLLKQDRSDSLDNYLLVS
jgi:deoxycytidylate deaminase